MATDDASGLYGPEGSLARFTRAAKGIHEIAEKLRADSDRERARLVREALQKVGREHGGMIVSGAAFTLAEQGTDEMLAKLGRLLK